MGVSASVFTLICALCFDKNPVRRESSGFQRIQIPLLPRSLPRRSSSQVGLEYLLVERYDRKHLTIDSALGVERLHQVDFC